MTTRAYNGDMISTILRLLLMAMCIGSIVVADTVRLKNGHTLRGLIKEENKERVVLQVGTGTLTFPAAKVATIERGDTDEQTRN